MLSFQMRRNRDTSQVSVLMLSWTDENPQIPVSQEIDSLELVFRDIDHFETERWGTADKDSHFKLAEKVIAFTRHEDDSASQLKILYYAGHARLMDARNLAWTRYRSTMALRCVD